MKTKTSKPPKKSKSTVQLKDIKPKKNPAGGRHKMFAIIDRTQ